ncbi:MAG: polysaccharide lyase family 8 super-sandwich domain-containing protein [Alistipes indistinctus]
MDRAVHTTPQFAVGLAMSSARIENYETINGEKTSKVGTSATA